MTFSPLVRRLLGFRAGSLYAPRRPAPLRAAPAAPLRALSDDEELSWTQR